MQPAPQDLAQLMEMQKTGMETVQFEAGVELDTRSTWWWILVDQGVDAENKKAQLALDIELETQKRPFRSETQAQVDENNRT